MKQDDRSLEIRSFAEKVTRAVSKKIGEKGQVKLQEVIKNNGIILQGLVVLTEGKNISPTIYLNSLFDAYLSGVTLSRIVDKIMDIYESEMPEMEVDMAFFRDFDRVKDRICYRLINQKKNELLLDQIPHMDVMDLSLCFFYAYQGPALGNGSILIHNSHVDMWKTNTSELMRLATQNTKKLFPWKMMEMADVIKEVMEFDAEAELPMKIVTNNTRIFGATCMIYPEVLENIAERFGENFYILPSSVHEVLVMPHSAVDDPETTQKMVQEINSEHVEAEEILSDSLYFYDNAEKCIHRINYLPESL